MISLNIVTENDKTLLWNINQKYLYEMTAFYPDDMDGSGNYHYGYFEKYFTETDRKAYLIYKDEALAGFAMLNKCSYIGQHPDWVLAEFCVFPSYRRQHIALGAIARILEIHRGKWEIKFSERNSAAKCLWEKVTREYNPLVYHLNEEETVLVFLNVKGE